MRHAGADQRVQFRLIPAGFEPLEEVFQRLLQAFARRCLEVHHRPIKPPRHHLHRLIATQCSNIQCPCGITRFRCWKQPMMPIQKTGEGKGLGVLLGGVHHKIGQAFTATADAGVLQRLQAQAPCQ